MPSVRKVSGLCVGSLSLNSGLETLSSQYAKSIKGLPVGFPFSLNLRSHYPTLTDILLATECQKTLLCILFLSSQLCQAGV